MPRASRISRRTFLKSAVATPAAAIAAPYVLPSAALGLADAGAVRLWTKANFPDTESCAAMVFDRENPRRLLLGSRPSGLWQPLDGGQSWARKQTIMPAAPVAQSKNEAFRVWIP